MLEYIKSPLNYIGGKGKLLNQILPLFPKEIDKFVDLFCGGCNVSINVDAKTIYSNDVLYHLINLFKGFKNNPTEEVVKHIENQIVKFELSKTNTESYNTFRKHYNEFKNPLDLFVLVAFAFQYYVRFNTKQQFNSAKGNGHFSDKMKNNLIGFVDKLHNTDIKFSTDEFQLFDFSILTENDFLYADPPYLITNGSYNDGKRGFTGWSEKEEYLLLDILDNLNKRNIKFALSNVIDHKGKSNDILKNWIKNNEILQVHYINAKYSLGNNVSTSNEVLITNY